MSLNLLNEKAFNDYLTDIVYQGESVPKQQSYNGEFESPDYVEQHRDEIVKGILNQYIKLRLRQHVLTLEKEPAFELVDKRFNEFSIVNKCRKKGALSPYFVYHVIFRIIF